MRWQKERGRSVEEVRENARGREEKTGITGGSSSPPGRHRPSGALVPRAGAVGGGPGRGGWSRIAIVGGGLAGLTAAMTLVDAGYTPTIYEALPNRGGGASSPTARPAWVRQLPFGIAPSA